MTASTAHLQGVVSALCALPIFALLQLQLGTMMWCMELEVLCL